MFKTLKVLVCGGRDFANIPLLEDNKSANFSHPDFDKKMKEVWFVRKVLYNICDEFNLWCEEDEYGNKLPMGIEIISGSAKGVDSAAVDWAIVNWVTFKEYPADWKTHGKAAGPIRNKEMLEKEKPDLVVAFPGGKGTANMIKQTKEAKISLRIIEYDKEKNQNDNII